MILAFSERYNVLCMWYYDDEMVLHYWDDDKKDDCVSCFDSLQEVRTIVTYEFIYDTGDA